MRPILRFGLAIILCLGVNLALHAAPLLGAHAAIPLAGRSPHPFPPGSARLYRATADWRELQPLDSRSLADLQRPLLPTGLRLVANQNPTMVASSDGSRFAVLDELPYQQGPVRGRDMTLQVFDARTGKPLTTRRHPAVPLGLAGISVAGSIAYGFRADIDTNTPCASSPFVLLDTQTGRVIRQLTVAAHPWDPILVGPNLGRLYTMTASDHINGCGPDWAYSPVIAAYDLRSGKLVRSVRLKGVLAGNWNTNRTLNGEPIGENWQPGFTLSPDGSQLAVLDGHTDTLTLLDARTLRITGREPLSRPRSALQTVAALLGLAPNGAEAKGEIDGAMVQLQYTADGHSLIATGARLRPDKRHLYSSSESLGIRLIDVQNGHIRAWLRDGKRLNGIWLAPDGSALYSSVQGWTRQGGWLSILRRHDPATLQVRAQRTFAHTNWLSLVFLR